MTADLSALIARLEAGPVYLTHKEAYDLAIFFGSDTALGMASLIRKAFAGGSLDAALALAERVLPGKEWMLVKSTEGGETSFHALIGPDSLGRAGEAASAALALCIAILRAKQGEG